MNTNTEDYEVLASEIAREAHEHNFESHWGASELEDGDGFYVFDNHPYQQDPDRRPRQHAELIAYLETRGCKLLATASYPDKGDEAGYTVAHVLQSADPSTDRLAAETRHREIFIRDIGLAAVAS